MGYTSFTNNNPRLESLKDVPKVTLSSEQWSLTELVSSETQPSIHHWDTFPYRIFPLREESLKIDKCFMHKGSDCVISVLMSGIGQRYTLGAPRAIPGKPKTLMKEGHWKHFFLLRSYRTVHIWQSLFFRKKGSTFLSVSRVKESQCQAQITQYFSIYHVLEHSY